MMAWTVIRTALRRYSASFVPSIRFTPGRVDLEASSKRQKADIAGREGHTSCLAPSALVQLLSRYIKLVVLSVVRLVHCSRQIFITQGVTG